MVIRAMAIPAIAGTWETRVVIAIPVGREVIMEVTMAEAMEKATQDLAPDRTGKIPAHMETNMDVKVIGIEIRTGTETRIGTNAQVEPMVGKIGGAAM